MEVNVIMVFLHLPRVNTLGEKFWWHVMNQFAKSEGWVSLTSLHSRYLAQFLVEHLLNLGIWPLRLGEVVWGLYHVLFDSFHRLDVVALIKDSSVINIWQEINERVAAISLGYLWYGNLAFFFFYLIMHECFVSWSISFLWYVGFQVDKQNTSLMLCFGKTFIVFPYSSV